MSIAFDASTIPTYATSISSQTFAHTCTGSNLILHVFIALYDASDTVTGVTYNGVAMTAIGTPLTVGGGVSLYTFELVNPNTGTHNVVISATGTCDAIVGSAISHTGAKQTSQPDSHATADDPSTSDLAITTTTIVDNTWLVGCAKVVSGHGFTAGSGTTIRGTVYADGGLGLIDSNGSVGIGSQSLHALPGATEQVSGSVVSITPAATSIAFDAGTNEQLALSATSLTYAHTTSGSNRILFVGVSGDSTSDLITGVTYNGVAMTLISKKAAGGSNRWMYLYYLVAPATGSHNVVISASGTCDAIVSVAASYTEAQQTGVPDSFASKQDASAPFDIPTTVVSSNCWLVGVFEANAGVLLPGTGTTSRTTGGRQMFDSNGTVGTGSQFLEANDANGHSGVVASFIAETGAPVVSTSRNLTLLGVG